MTDNVTPTGFDATVTLGSIVSEALGPVPRVCPETVLLDLERARMTAEDLRSAAIAPSKTVDNAQRQVRELSQTIDLVVNIVRNADGGTAQQQEDALSQLRIELREGMSDNEDNSEEDGIMDSEGEIEESDEESGGSDE